MKLKFVYLIVILLLVGCTKKSTRTDNIRSNEWLNSAPLNTDVLKGARSLSERSAYSHYIRQAAKNYGVDEALIKAIIQVESDYNPDAVSRSNAVGLMQIKASTAGRDAYRLQGRNGEPSLRELKDPALNIDIGTAYINILQNQHLVGINDPQTLRYATIVSYVNGAGAMLRTFSPNKRLAVNLINKLSPNEFYQHIQNKHPAPQAPRYLWKVNTAYRALLE